MFKTIEEAFEKAHQICIAHLLRDLNYINDPISKKFNRVSNLKPCFKKLYNSKNSLRQMIIIAQQSEIFLLRFVEGQIIFNTLEVLNFDISHLPGI